MFLLAGCAGPETGGDGLAHLAGRSWMELRFTDMIAQKKDYTCGAASLATLLTHHYGLDVSEGDVLAVANVEDGNKVALTAEAEADSVAEAKPDNVKIEGFTYADLARFSAAFGFTAKGIKTDYSTLRNLKRPVIAYLEGDGFNHFVVIRQVTADWIYVADPTWGNRRYVRGRFEDIWAIDRGEGGKRLGRILAVLPAAAKARIDTQPDFFNPI